jgi:uncharacterized membrane protein YeaQ/YmgE (transglycosylase-associated protein family)
MQYVWMAVVGFLVGLLARALLPGNQSMGIILTSVLGIAGSFAAGFVGEALGWYKAGEGRRVHRIAGRRHRAAVRGQQAEGSCHAQRPVGRAMVEAAEWVLVPDTPAQIDAVAR